MIAGKVAVILQARTGSTRLPGKALMPIGGATVLSHCITRLQVADVGPLLVATTTLPADDAIVQEAWRLGVTAFRGPIDDVLTRFLDAARMVGAEYIIRATGDNPAVDCGSAARLVEVLRGHRVDHAVEDGLPYGSTVEAVRTVALRESEGRAQDPADREHVTSFMRRHGAGFRCVTMRGPASIRRPDLRFTVDTLEDLGYMRRVITEAERHQARPVPLEQLIVAADAIGNQEEVA